MSFMVHVERRSSRRRSRRSRNAGSKCSKVRKACEMVNDLWAQSVHPLRKRGIHIDWWETLRSFTTTAHVYLLGSHEQLYAARPGGYPQCTVFDPHRNTPRQFATHMLPPAGLAEAAVEHTRRKARLLHECALGVPHVLMAACADRARGHGAPRGRKPLAGPGRPPRGRVVQ